jgi:hypothetical protein
MDKHQCRAAAGVPVGHPMPMQQHVTDLQLVVALGGHSG